jgi:hypothetical protein
VSGFGKHLRRPRGVLPSPIRVCAERSASGGVPSAAGSLILRRKERLMSRSSSVLAAAVMFAGCATTSLEGSALAGFQEQHERCAQISKHWRAAYDICMAEAGYDCLDGHRNRPDFFNGFASCMGGR